MPEMDGIEACEQLKKDPATKDIPVIFLTAKADSDDIVKGFETGAVDYVTKPFNGTELLSRVKNHLDLKFSHEALAQLNATRDKFFSIIAHDLKDPLQFLLLAAHSLHENYDTFDEDKRRDYIHRFYNNSQTLSLLLENLLEWAQSQRGALEIVPEKIDIRALVSETIDLLNNNARKKDILLLSQIEPRFTAFADINTIRTVIRNLVSNAVKFTYPGGRVTVAASLTARGDRVEITVSDTGVGMDADILADLFRIDVKHTTRGTAEEKGTGLGLLLCKEFIERNNGTLTVTSEPGQGSCFTFTLPVQAVP
ncbi:MAG: response regulator, partial [bacterium]|nr:response regulator [bacterium]